MFKGADVQRVARKYLAPDNLSVVIYGKLTDEDKAGLGERFTLKTLEKSEVFTGGYDEPAAQEAGGPAERD